MKVAIVTLALAVWLACTGAAWAYLPLVHGETVSVLSADEFGRALVEAASQYGGPKVVDVHCVPGDPNDYMCSYALLRRGRLECHLMQGRYAPDTMQIVVTLAGRTKRCATLRDAVQSLD